MVPDVWGVVATANAPLLDIARFCAHHLYEGAEVIFIYLDKPDVEVIAALATLPQIKVIPTDNAYWSSKGARPENIEQRQSRNARDAARKMKDQFPHLKWLRHLDIDEFITMAPTVKMGRRLAMQPPDCQCVRIMPMENLIPDEHGYSGPEQFKFLKRQVPERRRISKTIFPEFGEILSGGFLSHQAGKVFFRLSGDKIIPKIHSVIIDGEKSPGERTLIGIDLAHFHVKPWEEFKNIYSNRRTKGSYRDGHTPDKKRKNRKLSLVTLFDQLEAREGIVGIRRLFDEVCVATPSLVERLTEHDVYRTVDMEFSRKIFRYFDQATF